jgi:endonuclease/exonuclease/phosphatase family metal-dependent hydrolase
MLLLTWNLFHGRSLPPTRGALAAQFAAKLAEWPWDVALLQEVPPWWPAEFAAALGAEQRIALTSRNSLPALRRAVARRDAELLKSNGGGCNAVLSRLPIVEHDTMRLRSWPERRVAQLVRLGGGACAVNLHASTRPALARQELARVWQRALQFADGAPLILGGDLNLREPVTPRMDIAHVVAENVDHVFTRGLATEGDAQVLARSVALGARRVELSDHAPLSVDLGEPTGAREAGRGAC